MLCPVCDVEMIVLEVDDIEVDHCIECKGIWLDSGELDLLIEHSGGEGGRILEEIRSRGRKPQDQKRRCPVCNKKMLEVDVKVRDGFVIDCCPNGDGVWLDDEELGMLIDSTGGTPATEALARLCGKMFKTERAKAPHEADNVGTDPSQ